jgi:uncharacterized protein YcbX
MYRLVWCPPDAQRKLNEDERYGKLMADGDSTAFADTAQYHIACGASLAALNETLVQAGAAVPMNRFRPNIVISGTSCWEEDTWKMVRLGGLGGGDGCGAPPSARLRSARLRVCMPDIRCHVTTIVQEGPDAGKRDKSKQPLAALQNLREAKLRKGAIFGVKLNLATEKHLGAVLRIGDEFCVEERTIKSLMSLDLDEMSSELLGTAPRSRI